ncbi:hypothetical protein GCM10023186_22490 [Hymenobacter koreensis]|uniref:Uncharacterized protein n=1 Tax=Hymenobacter koreensis TaxID=1084523 RepID=A0ABP8IZR0_9BACT
MTAASVQLKSYTEQYLDSTSILKDGIIVILAALAKQEQVRLGERTKVGLTKHKESS